MLLQPVNLQRTGFAYKLRSFLRKLLLANCPSFTSQVRTDLMSTLHLQSHVSSLSQSWTNFLFTTAPCGKDSFFFFLFHLQLQFLLKMSLNTLSLRNVQTSNRTPLRDKALPAKQGSVPASTPAERAHHPAQPLSANTLRALLWVAWEGDPVPGGTLQGGQRLLTPRRKGTSQPLHFPSPFPLRETLCKQVKESQPQRNHGIKRHCPDCS